MAARTTQLALLVDQLMPATQTIPLVLAGIFKHRRTAIVVFGASLDVMVVHWILPNFFSSSR